ncbi:MAG: class I SAM-dependent methyltransferase [Cyclobacteriaceae bacterium]|nr:class I SAM-dependent methyltransferase [Cyclobacteriaceae bacterium]
MFFRKDFQLFSNLSVQEKIYDNLSYQIIKDYLPSIDYPYTSSCLNYYKIHILINDLVLNRRSNYIELGSGLSTLALGLCIKKQALNCKIKSFEHDEHFLNIQLENIENMKLTNIIELCHAPIKFQHISGLSCDWYDDEVIFKKIGNEKFDLMLVDGPPAYKQKISYNRFPALPKLLSKLKENCSIYIDDTNRKGESNSLKRWEKSYKIKFRHLSPTFRHHAKGDFKNPFI